MPSVRNKHVCGDDGADVLKREDVPDIIENHGDTVLLHDDM